MSPNPEIAPFPGKLNGETRHQRIIEKDESPFCLVCTPLTKSAAGPRRTRWAWTEICFSFGTQAGCHYPGSPGGQPAFQVCRVCAETPSPACAENTIEHTQESRGDDNNLQLCAGVGRFLEVVKDFEGLACRCDLSWHIQPCLGME